MRKAFTAAVMATAIVGSLSLAGPPAHAKDGVGVAIVGGLIAGAAIGAAIADNKKHNTNIYVEPRRPPPPQPFSPKAGIVCYPAQHACYHNDGSYAAKWTRRVYAR